MATGDRLEPALGNPEVWDVAPAHCESDNRPLQTIATMLHVYRQLVGASEEDRRECRRRTSEPVALQGSVPNAGFEPGVGDAPLGWSPASWAPEQGESTARRVEGGHSGRRAIRLEGRSDKVNPVAQAAGALQVQGKQGVELPLWYRTEGAPGPYASLLGFDKDGERVQDDSSAPFEPSEQWGQARHLFRPAPGVVTAQIIVRNSSRDAVVYDDASVRVLP